jgi:type III secretion protein Y
MNTNTNTNAKDVLHGLGYLYGRHGQTRRALALQLIAARLAPDDAGVLRSLAHAFLQDGEPDRALAVIHRLDAMPGAGEAGLQLLKSRALWAAGRRDEARDAFRLFLERRRQAHP